LSLAHQVEMVIYIERHLRLAIRGILKIYTPQISR